MLEFFTILIAIVCVLLTLIVLAQKPKGGGLSGTFGGLTSNVLGHQRTTDILEKATWTLAIVLMVFSLLTKFFIAGPDTLGPVQEGSDLSGASNQAPAQLEDNSGIPVLFKD